MRHERERVCLWCRRAIDGEGDYCTDDCALAANQDRIEDEDCVSIWKTLDEEGDIEWLLLPEDQSHISTVSPDYEDLYEDEPDGGDWEELLSDVEWQRERLYNVRLED